LRLDSQKLDGVNKAVLMERNLLAVIPQRGQVLPPRLKSKTNSLR